MYKLTGKQILLVEDEVLIGMSTKMNLEKKGYNVIHACTPEKAISTIEDNENISLVLMDIDLGSNIDGIKTAKQMLERKDLPIVFVSSHTEPEIISLTEEITSYGYVVKDSNIVAYDASIKMAYRLFIEKKRKEIFSIYIQTALENANEPLFICDTNGDIVFLNKAYLAVQGLTDSNLVKHKFEDYSKEITVYSTTGERLNKQDWASTRPLHGKVGDNVILYVYNHSIKKVLVNYYSYAPIYNNMKAIIGSYVKIGSNVENSDERIIELIRREMNHQEKDVYR